MKFSQCSTLRLLAHQCLVFFVALCAICSTTNAQPIRLATHDQAPYGTYQQDNSFDGVAVRVIQCVFKRMGRAVQVEVYRLGAGATPGPKRYRAGLLSCNDKA